MATDLGDRLRQARKAASVSREDLARRVGVSFKTIQNYETGATAPDMDRLSAMAEVLGQTAEWFMRPSERVPLHDAAARAGVTADYVEGAAVLVLTVRAGDSESTHELRWVHGPPLALEITTGSAARSPLRRGVETD